MDKEHVTKIIDVLYNECMSAGGDGDALWYAKYYKIEDILEIVKEYNSKLPSPMEIELKNDNTIHWGIGQEWITITTDEQMYKNAPEWSQFVLKG